MSRVMAQALRYRLGDWIVDAQSNRILRGNIQVLLEPRLMDLLVYFCQHPNQTLDRLTLLEDVWGSQHFTDSTVSRGISVLRSSLGDDSKKQHYLKTIPRRGYQLVAEVEALGPTTLQSDARPADAPSKADRPRRRRWVGLISGSLAAGAIMLGWQTWQNEQLHSKPPLQSIAVVPFQHSAAQSIPDFLTNGLHEEVAMHLARSRFPRIYLLDQQNSQEAIRLTNADAVLLGRVVMQSDQIEVLLSLEDSKTHALLWSDVYHAKPNRLLHLRNQILQGIDNRLATSETLIDPPAPMQTSEEAYRLYLNAAWHWRQRTPEDLRSAQDLYQQAIQLDPEFTDAYAGLALCQLTMINYTLLDAKTGYAKATQLTRKALALNPNHAQSLIADAQIQIQKDWDFNHALQKLDRVIAQHPDLPEPLQYKAETLSILGRYNEAIVFIDRAVALKPQSTLMLAIQGMIYSAAGQFERADAIFQNLETLKPGFFWYYRYWSYARMGMGDVQGAWDKRLTRFRYTLSPEDYDEFRNAMGKQPNKRFWNWQIARLQHQYPQPTGISSALAAEAHAARGDLDEAMRWINQSVNLKGEALPLALVSPWFKPLRNRADYRQLLTRYNLHD